MMLILPVEVRYYISWLRDMSLLFYVYVYVYIYNKSLRFDQEVLRPLLSNLKWCLH